MSYQSATIEEIIKRIGKNEIYLPAIQRKFVWDYDQIESLFDSIMRGYPIGTFLFWFIEGDKKNEYTFYKFIQEYHEKNNYLNEKAPKPELKDKIIGILDGQQRLSSMYVALQGSYSYKRRYARWDNDKAFLKRLFFINLLYEKSEDDNHEYEFKFLTINEARKYDKTHLWFPIKKVIEWGKDPDIDEYYDDLIDRNKISSKMIQTIKKNRRKIKKILRILHQRIVNEELINFFKIEELDLDKILDIFIRVNSGGTVLSKSDLLFSTIVANWEEGREEIEKFLEMINDKGDGFWFDTDFIMRSCLVLTDCPVLFKVNNFKKENIEKIKNKWDKIKDSIEYTVNLLVEFGFNGENLTSQNAIIPISYYILKGGLLKSKQKLRIRKYLIHSLLKQIYGGQGDIVLSRFRDQLIMRKKNKQVLKRNAFDFNNLISIKLPGNRSLEINEEDLDNIIDYKKGPYTFMVLSLLYPQLKFGQIKFHQDHIHPASLFTDAKLKKYKIPKNKWAEWKSMKDKLPNLQIMEGRENVSKNKTPFEKWLKGKDNYGNPNVNDIAKFKKDNYIPKTSFKFKNFEKFYKLRRKSLYMELKKILLF